MKSGKQELYVGGEKPDLKEQSFSIVIYLKQLIKDLVRRR